MTSLPALPKSFTVRGRLDLRAYVELLRYHSAKTPAFARVHYAEVIEGDIPALERIGPRPVAEADVVEVGCGNRAGATLILNTLGARVVGIDYDHPDPDIRFASLVRIARENGIERAVKTFVRHVLFDRRYYRELERVVGRPLRRNGLDLRRMDACDLDFPDDTFDYVISHAVFEHIHDVPKALAEVQRVLRPDGIARIALHLFPSLSGGHRLEWAYPDESPSATVPPWDHLRERRFPPIVYLNELRESEYLALFVQYFDVVDVQTTSEGEHLLTEELRRELSGYGAEDLTHKDLIVLMKKPRANENDAASP